MRVITGKSRGTKLYTLEGDATRPTLDRVKESLFSIIQNRIPDAVVLDLFAGSGALGIEALSRGASSCVFCDKSKNAIEIITKNLEKTHLKESSKLYATDYKTCLNSIKEEKMYFDIIFLDPPYNSEFIHKAIENIINLGLLKENGIIIAETDCEEKIIKELENLSIKLESIKRYGRVKLLFLKEFTSSEGMI